MPVVKNYTELPDWAEVKFYEIIKLKPNFTLDVLKKYDNEIVFLVSGTCIINYNTEKNI